MNWLMSIRNRLGQKEGQALRHLPLLFVHIFVHVRLAAKTRDTSMFAWLTACGNKLRAKAAVLG